MNRTRYNQTCRNISKASRLNINRKPIFNQPRETQNTIHLPNIQNFCIQRKLSQQCMRGIENLKRRIDNEIMTSERGTITLLNRNLPCAFPYSHFACQSFPNDRSTCCTVHNCPNLLPSEMNADRQEWGVSRSASDGRRRTPYSFPDWSSLSEPISVIRRCPLSVLCFL